MNRNVVVTRTISAGNCRSNARTFSTPGDEQFPTARRHSSAGIRALKWATASARSLGSSLGSDNRSSKDSHFNIVVTPDSIPQFTIPSLALQDGSRCFGKDRERQREDSVEEGWGSAEDETASLKRQLMLTSLSSSSSSSSSGFGSSPPLGRRAHRSISDPSNHKLPHENSSALLEAEDFPDPVTRAALSLPHLPKVTTPYGFLTLGQSPQMASEEALFFQVGHRRWIKEDDGTSHKYLISEAVKNSFQTRQTQMPTSTSSPVQLRHHPSPKCDRGAFETVTAKQTTHSSVGHSKSRFWGILRKHLCGEEEPVTVHDYVPLI